MSKLMKRELLEEGDAPPVAAVAPQICDVCGKSSKDPSVRFIADQDTHVFEGFCWKMTPSWYCETTLLCEQSDTTLLEARVCVCYSFAFATNSLVSLAAFGLGAFDSRLHQQCPSCLTTQTHAV